MCLANNSRAEVEHYVTGSQAKRQIILIYSRRQTSRENEENFTVKVGNEFICVEAQTVELIFVCFVKFAFAQRLDRNVKFISSAYPFVVNNFTVCYMAIYGCLSSHEVKKPISLGAHISSLMSNFLLLSLRERPDIM